MGNLSKKLVSIVTTLVVSAGLAFTSLPAVEAKATTTAYLPPLHGVRSFS